VLVICGPGNNGGDGLVCSRHMFHFGYSPTVLYPKQTDKPLYKNLVLQNQLLNISVLSDLPKDLDSEYQLIVDAIFGYSFKGDIRSPFDKIIEHLNERSHVPILSVDVPSGWNIMEGNIGNKGLRNPAMLVSLTAPKLCAKWFNGVHYLGGRFVPPSMAKQYDMNLPAYPGDAQVVLLGRGNSSNKL